ncbi:hypothetical protein [Pseudonocardia broussonetiae]|nr:hypothetical protein [Pseudonocardia broussonetiae]
MSKHHDKQDGPPWGPARLVLALMAVVVQIFDWLDDHDWWLWW